MSSPNLILYSKYSYLASCCLLLDLWYFAFLGLVEATRPPFLAGDHHQDLASRGCPVYCLAARVWSVKMRVMTVVILTDQTLGAKQKSRQSVGQLSCFAWPSHGMCWRTVTWSEQWSDVCEDCKWQPNQKCECLSVFHSLRVEVMLFFCSWNFAQSFVWRCGEKFLWPSRFSPAFWGKANSFAMDGAWVWQLSTWKRCNLKHRTLLPSCLCSNPKHLEDEFSHGCVLIPTMQTVQGVRSWHGSVLTKCKCMASSTCVFTCCSWQDHRLLFHTGGLFWLLCLLWCSQCSLREFRGTSWNSNIAIPCLTFFHVSMFFLFWQKEFSSVVSFACLFFLQQSTGELFLPGQKMPKASQPFYADDSTGSGG